jgi:NTE family protein
MRNRNGSAVFPPWILRMCGMIAVFVLWSCAPLNLEAQDTANQEQTFPAQAPTADTRPAIREQGPGVDRRAVVPGRRERIGIAFEGGGALGLAHLGVVAWMNQQHVPIDAIAGTSMGALIGALVAAGKSSEDLQRLANSDVFGDMFTLKPSLSHLSFRRREDRNELSQALTFGLRGGGVTLGNALITDDRLNAFLSGEFVSYNTGGLDYDQLPIPFRCVATDLTTLRPAVFASGPLAFAVRASISIPGVFPPVRSNGDILVDGAIVDNLPTDVLRQELHADVVIAVHLTDAAFQSKDASSLASIFGRAFQAGTSRNEEISRKQADIQILPAVASFSATDYNQAAALIKAGYDAAEKERDRLLPYALSEQDWKSYQLHLASRKRVRPGRIESVRVEGPSPALSATLSKQADKLANKPFDEPRTEALVSEVRGNGAMNVFYETFRTPQPSPQNASAPHEADNGIVLHWRPNWDGPPYLLLGSDITAMNSNVSKAVVDLRLIDQNLGSYGSELRSDVRLGYLTQLGTEYYLRINQTPFFVKPNAQYFRSPVYYWEDQKRVSERLLQRAGGGLDAGITLNRNFQAALQYKASTIRWVLKDGTDDSPTQHLSGVVQSAAVHLLYSNRTAEIASPTGSQVDLTVGHLLHPAGSSQAPFLTLKTRQSFTFATRNLFVVSANADTYFRNNVADPLRFTLGGPLRLSASSVDEYRGTDTVLGQGMYLRQIANLPTGLGQGIYFVTGYEAGAVWSPERPSFLRQDGLAGVLLNTPLGTMTIGGSVGDAGRRKAFFTLGKLF